MTDNMNNDDNYCDSLDIAARNAALRMDLEQGAEPGADG